MPRDLAPEPMRTSLNSSEPREEWGDPGVAWLWSLFGALLEPFCALSGLRNASHPVAAAAGAWPSRYNPPPKSKATAAMATRGLGAACLAARKATEKPWPAGKLGVEVELGYKTWLMLV